MPEKRKILITNDDGINADGVIRLARAALKYGDVWVVAPESERSAASHSITLKTYIDAYEYAFPVKDVKAYAVFGSPADCVRIGALNIVPGKPDLVLSGINYGYNAGTDVQYSATVGAAMEAVFQEIPAIAFSEAVDDGFKITEQYLDSILEEVIDTPFEHGTIVNVNFPACHAEAVNVKGILRDRKVSCSSVFNDTYSCEDLPDGGKRYMVQGALKRAAEEGSDLRALMDGYISIGKVTNIH